MQSATRRDIAPLAIVLSSGEIGSAIAHRLHRERFGVVLIDAIDPPWARRGRSFTDAWYLGSSELEGVAAVFCASVRSIPSVLHRAQAIVATTWSWPGVSTALQADALIDARERDVAELSPPLACVPPYTIAIGAMASGEVDALIAPPARASRNALGVESPAGGRFATGRQIGDWVRTGDTLGAVDGHALAAPCDGYLCALAARGARVGARMLLAEVQVGASRADCFGIEARERAIADGVFKALERRFGGRLLQHDPLPRGLADR